MIAFDFTVISWHCAMGEPPFRVTRCETGASALVPLVGWFFRVRDADGNLQMPRLARAGKTGNGRVPATSGDGPTLSA